MSLKLSGKPGAVQFQETCDVLVLDLCNNPGGDMLRMYEILAGLTDRPLEVPKHELRLTEDDVTRARAVLRRAAYPDPDNPAHTPSPELAAYSRFVIDEAQAGRGPGSGENTRPTCIFGIERIVPTPTPFTKPLVVTVNELTFSAAEFAAAILQDNQRAQAFGSRTAGAGGMMREFVPEGSELFGSAGMTLTWTLAWRTTGEPIENHGVTPDIEYALAIEDLTADFTPYRAALEAAVNTAAGFDTSAVEPGDP